MKRVLVTGASGFIGRHAAAELARRGYEIIAPTSSELNLLAPPAVEQFLRETRPSHLAHFAWFAQHGKSQTAVENAQWNVESKSLFEQFAASGGRHAFFAGSCAEYDWNFQTLSESNTPDTPANNTYGAAKRRLRADIFQSNSARLVTVAWGRIFFVYGPGEKETRFAPSILKPLLRGEPAVVRFGKHVRDFLHAADVARAAAHLLDQDYHGTVNIASGNPVTLADFATTLARLAKAESLLKIERGEPTPDNPLILKADVERLRSTGFAPQYPLAKGLQTLLPA